MEKELVFQILGISETKDENEIRDAYRRILKNTNPEDDPEGFKRLRQAFEEAVKLVSRQEQDGEEDLYKNDVDLWIDRVEALYRDLLSRAQTERWKELMSDPVCEGLDTALEAREKIIVFLMDHINLPHPVWKLIDDTFEITADIRELKEKYPANFLNYMKYYVENETFIPYDLFEYRGSSGEDLNGDGYINEYFNIKRLIDDEQNTSDCLARLENLKAFHIYHPFEDVERLRLLILENKCEAGVPKAEELLAKYGDDLYIRLHVGRLKWGTGEKERAYELWKSILEQSPDHYTAKLCCMRYLMEQKNYYDAREMLLELLAVNDRDEELQKNVHAANEALIGEFRNTLASGKEDPRLPGDELKLKLGWCLLQNERLEEAYELADSFSPESRQEYGFNNLYGQLLYRMERYGEAVPYLCKWIEMIEGLTDDGTAETKKRIDRLSVAHAILSYCYYELGNGEEGEKEAEKSVDAAANIRERLERMQYFADRLLFTGKYEKSVDICDKILEEDTGFYPAYLIRQESCYHMRRAQQVVDDYHRAVDIYAGFYKPYLFAAKVFFNYNQYEDAKKVIDRARENQVEFSADMKLYEAMILRNLSHGKEDRKLPKEILEKLAGELDKENCDIKDKSAVAFERGLLCWDDNEFEPALAFMEDAIAQNPERMQYRLVRGHIYLEMKKYKEALEEYEAAGEAYKEWPELYYNRACAYEGLNEEEPAIENFKKTLEIDDKYRKANEKLGSLYREKHNRENRKTDYEQALYYLNKQLEIKENYTTIFHRARLYDDAMEIELSLKDYEKALEYWPDDDAALCNMGFCYRACGQFEKALSYFERAKNLLEKKKAKKEYYQMIKCYIALHRYEEALKYCKEGSEIFPNDSDFMELAGSVYERMQEYDKALDAYGKMKGLNDDCYDDMAEVWIRKGKPKKGIRVLEEGLRKVSGSRKAKSYNELGDIYYVLAEYNKSIDYYFKATLEEKDPWNLFSYELELARACYLAGNYEPARGHAKNAFENMSKAGRSEEDYIYFKAYAPVRTGYMGWLYLCLGDKEKARENFEAMERLQPCRYCEYEKCFESTLWLGLFYESQGDYRRAIELMEETLRRNPNLIQAQKVLEKLRRKV